MASKHRSLFPIRRLLYIEVVSFIPLNLQGGEVVNDFLEPGLLCFGRKYTDPAILNGRDFAKGRAVLLKSTNHRQILADGYIVLF